MGLDAKTAARYLAVFEQMFLLRRLSPWAANRPARVVNSPKLHFVDAGLLASLTGVGEAAVAADRTRFGAVLEAWVAGELLKQLGWGDDGVELHHYRDKDQAEVDFLLESPDGRLLGIEVRTSATVATSDFAGLRKLAALAGKAWRAGYLLYDGPETLPMGPGMWAVPLAGLALG